MISNFNTKKKVTMIKIWKTIINVVDICLKPGSTSTVNGNRSSASSNDGLVVVTVSIKSSFVGVMASNEKPLFYLNYKHFKNKLSLLLLLRKHTPFVFLVFSKLTIYF